MISAREASADFATGKTALRVGREAIAMQWRAGCAVSRGCKSRAIAAPFGCSILAYPSKSSRSGLGGSVRHSRRRQTSCPFAIGRVEFPPSNSVRAGGRLGHTECGALETTLQQLQRPIENQCAICIPRGFDTAIRRKPVSTALRTRSFSLAPAEVRAKSTRREHLRHGSDIIEQLIQGVPLMVVGAEYSMETGVVDFFDALPETNS